MAKTIGRLTAMQVDSPTLEARRHGDGGNLYLDAKPDGNRSWRFIYRFAGKQREAGLGKAGKGGVPLKDARAKAAEGRAMLNERPPRDPLSVWRPAPVVAAPTFAACAKAHIERQDSRGLLGRNPKHVTQWRSTLASLPVWFQKLPVDEIGPEVVFKALDPIWSRTPETGMRLRGRIEAVLDSARKPDDLAANPAAWTGWLKLKLGSARKLGKLDRKTGQRIDRSHHAAVPYAAMPGFIAKLRVYDDIPARALEFVVLTASRTGEVVGMKWSEVDIESRVWEIPWQNHTVPLSGRAVEIIREMAALRTGDFVFGGRFDGEALGHAALWNVLTRRMRVEATVHAFRSSFRDWAGDCTNSSRETCEAALGHTLGGVEAAYRRSDALAKRRLLMDAWSAFCTPPSDTDAGNVVTLKRA
jgi:integrase